MRPLGEKIRDLVVTNPWLREYPLNKGGYEILLFVVNDLNSYLATHINHLRVPGEEMEELRRRYEGEVFKS